jgi:drug/metabolite transporter (DMT)-like permease
MISEALIVALIAVFIWVISGTVEKEVAKTLGGRETSFLILGAGLVSVAIYYAFFFSAQMDLTSLILSIASGVFFAVAALLYYKALETRQVSISYSIGLFQPAIIFIYSIIVLSEHVAFYQALSGFIVLIGVLLMATRKHLRFDRKLAPVFFANIFWAVYWILLSLAIIGTSQVGFPLLISRTVGTLLVVLLYNQVLSGVKRRSANPSKIRYVIILGLAAGLLDGAANTIYSYLVVLKALALGSIVTLLGPFFVVLLAYFIYKEKLTKIEGIGLILAALGALALAFA